MTEQERRLDGLAEAAFMALPRKRRSCSWRDLQRTGGDGDWIEAARAFCEALGFITDAGEVYVPDRGAVNVAVEALRRGSCEFSSRGCWPPKFGREGEYGCHPDCFVQVALRALTGKGEDDGQGTT